MAYIRNRCMRPFEIDTVVRSAPIRSNQFSIQRTDAHVKHPPSFRRGRLDWTHTGYHFISFPHWPCQTHARVQANNYIVIGRLIQAFWLPMMVSVPIAWPLTAPPPSYLASSVALPPSQIRSTDASVHVNRLIPPKMAIIADYQNQSIVPAIDSPMFRLGYSGGWCWHAAAVPHSAFNHYKTPYTRAASLQHHRCRFWNCVNRENFVFRYCSFIR